MENECEPDCTYFTEHPNNLGVGYLWDNVICDNHECSSNDEKFFSILIGCDTGFCRTGGGKNQVLEDKLDEVRMQEINKFHKGIKPMDPKTGNTQPYV